MYVRWFKDLTIKDILSVGGKTASLGEMYSKLTKKGVKVPNGFALTAKSYWEFLCYNELDKKIKKIVSGLNVRDIKALALAGKKIRKMIEGGKIPTKMDTEIKKAYEKLKGKGKASLAVRSSATAEDLPNASFAGQQETYLNVSTLSELRIAVKKCMASLYTDRAISYRTDKGFDHGSVALSVCVQNMVRSDLASSGVMFTLDTESGFNGVVLINGSYGLGEYVVKGRVVPDQFYVYKDGVKRGFKSIISRRAGSKEVKLVYADKGTKQERNTMADRKKFCLSDEEILKLAKWGIIIEEHYGRPMDIEWAKDGKTGELFIVQARSETVKSLKEADVIETYKLKQKGKVLANGISIGQKIGQGKVRIIDNPSKLSQFKAGEVLVTRITDPDWEPIMRIAGAIVTEQGGKTSHAAIVSRELGIPCLVGVKNARKILKKGELVTVSCAEGEEGYVYKGRLPFEIEKTEVKKIARTKTKIMMNVGDPDNAFTFSAIPNDGVGLAREEFVFSNFIKVHPMALVNYNKLKDKKTKEKIKQITLGYKDKKQYCVDKLAEGIAFIAAGFTGKDVILRLSDFKTNEYATLIGGKEFEPEEENPMLGWRGASRYYDPKYKQGFKLECLAIKKVREEWGLKNVIAMVPFCRTVEEGEKVLKTMKEFGLERGKDGLQVYVMCEIPSNVIMAEEFCKIFDGFSIGSNDLTQLSLGVDRDSALVSHIYDERNQTVKRLIRQVIQIAHNNGKKVGICGQAPSDYPEFAEFLVQEGIDSISLNPDTVLKTRERIYKAEKQKGGGRKNVRKRSLAVKMLFFLGAFGLTALLGGYGCQTVSNQKMTEDMQTAVEQEMLKLRGQLRQEISQELEKQAQAKRNQYKEDGFASFNLSYPSSWLVNHGQDSIRFISVDGKSWFSVVKQERSYSDEILEQASETEFFGYEARRFGGELLPPQKDEDFEVVEIYTAGYEDREDGAIVEFSGTKDYFDEILGSLKDFEIEAENS